MKLDFKKLQKIEKEYRQNGNSVCLSSLQTLVDLILTNEGTPLSELPLNYTIAYKTLEDLGIIINDAKVQQLNS